MVLSTRCYLVLHMRYNNVLMVTTLSILSLTHSLTASQLQRPLFPLSLVLCSDLCRRHRNRVAKPPHRHAAPAFHLNKKTQLAVLERPTSGCLSGAEHQAADCPFLNAKTRHRLPTRSDCSTRPTVSPAPYGCQSAAAPAYGTSQPFGRLAYGAT
jgi:hypothetical protein